MKQTNELPLMEAGAYKDRLRTLLYGDEPTRLLVMPALPDGISSPEQRWLERHCLDVPYLDEQITDERSLLLVECLPRSAGPMQKFSLSVTACCHRNLIALSADEKALCQNLYGLSGNRVDMIAAAVGRALFSEAAERLFGIGGLKPAPEKPVVPFLPGPPFYGKTLSFELFEMKKRGAYETGIF